MDVLTEDVRDGSLMELLYADNLALYGESLYEFMDKYGRWVQVWEMGKYRGSKRYAVIIWEEK